MTPFKVGDLVVRTNLSGTWLNKKAVKWENKVGPFEVVEVIPNRVNILSDALDPIHPYLIRLRVGGSICSRRFAANYFSLEVPLSFEDLL